MAELCALPTKEGAPPGPARAAPSHQQPSSPCHTPQSPSAGWWTLSPGAGWPAKIKIQVTLGWPCQVQSPPSLGLSRPLTFIKSVQELRILGGAGGTGNERKGSALWPRGARELGLASIGNYRMGCTLPVPSPFWRAKQSGRQNPPPQIRENREKLAPRRPGGTRGAHLSFTSSFTPELAWRAWFIMSYTRQEL